MRFFLFMGCALGCSKAATDFDGPRGPAYLADEIRFETNMDIEAIRNAIETAVSTLFTLNPAPVVAGYNRAIAGQDVDCPTWTPGEEGTPYWYSTCESTDGTQFDGFGLLNIYDNVAGEGGLVYSGEGLFSVSTIRTPEGYTFTGSGGLNNLQGIGSDGLPIHYISIEGGFSWDGPEAEGTWLTQGIDPDIQVYAVDAGAAGRSIQVEGAIEGLEGAQAVVFEQLVAADWGQEDDCGREPRGVISVLGDGGTWIDLEFTGASFDREADPETGCDQCANAWFRGSRIGEVCPDLSPLYEWGGVPLW